MSDVEKAHAADLDRQDTHGVKYLRYWVDEDAGRIFCLVEAPDADAAHAVHREAHGLVADEIFQVRRSLSVIVPGSRTSSVSRGRGRRGPGR